MSVICLKNSLLIVRARDSKYIILFLFLFLFLVPLIPVVPLSGQFGSQGALPLCYLSDSTSGSLKYTRFLVPVQYYFILLQTTMNSAGSRGTQVERRCSQMMSGSQWPRRRVLWCSAGCCAGSVERNPLSGFN